PLAIELTVIYHPQSIEKGCCERCAYCMQVYDPSACSIRVVLSVVFCEQHLRDAFIDLDLGIECPSGTLEEPKHYPLHGFGRKGDVVGVFVGRPYREEATDRDAIEQFAAICIAFVVYKSVKFLNPVDTLPKIGI